MNRKARRAALKTGQPAGNAVADKRLDALPTAELMARAEQLHRQRQLEKAQLICNKILDREPSHVNALNLDGLIQQAHGRHRLAAKSLGKAVEADSLNAACHYNLAFSLQALGREDEAMAHYTQAIVLGARLKSTEDLILRSPAITACIDRIEEHWPMPVKPDELFARHSLESIAGDLYLRCALATLPLNRAPLEKFLAILRATLLRSAASESEAMDGAIVRLTCAIAQQCFINEYVFSQSDEEAQQSARLRDALLQKLKNSEAIGSMLLAAVAAYFPLKSLPSAKRLLDRDWPAGAAEIIEQQVREPLEEAAERETIPALTDVDDVISLQVMRQYEENPYPRWTVDPLAAHEAALQAAGGPTSDDDILIAGCGSGQHVFHVAKRHPKGRILAVDISLPSLAYARRKAREADLLDVEFAQADILKLGSLGRSFDLIECIGVLHHLADPEAGWRILLSLLRPGGEMHIGLYSETGRRGLAPIRALITERGYRSTVDDIRKCRQDILLDPDGQQWRRATESSDFYTMSGCRDLLFHVMEHRFTIPRIKDFLDEQRLAFLGFNLDPQTIERFQAKFPGDDALTNLGNWQAFEADHPRTFQRMYVFSVRKD